MGFLSRLGFVVPLMVLGGCSSAGRPSGPDKLGQPVPTTTSITVDPKHVVSVAVPALSRCTVSAKGAEGDRSKALMAASEAAGVIRFYQPPATWGTELAVECETPEAKSVTTRVDLNDRTSFAMEDLSGLPRTVGTIPPLVGDPLAASQDDLFRMRYPHRPDPVKKPRQYAKWLDVVSKPFDVIESKSIAGSTSYAASGPYYCQPYPGTNNMPSWVGCTPGTGLSHWGGPEIQGGPWVISSIDTSVSPNFSGGGSHTGAMAAFWAGLGGFGSLMVQDGVILFGDGLDNYGRQGVQLFWEILGGPRGVDSGVQQPNFVIQYGDTVEVQVDAIDQNFSLNVNGGYAGGQIWNVSKNTYTQWGPVRVAGLGWAASPAEFITEVPGPRGIPQPALANFGSTWEYDLFACAAWGQFGCAVESSLATDPFTMWNMGEAPLCGNGGGGPFCTWSYFPLGDTDLEFSRVYQQWVQPN